jgi:hypothetical protein
MHICGADHHAFRPESRETGILEEILLENRKVNPQNSYSVFDSVLWGKASCQENLSLFLNAHMISAVQEEGAIKSVTAVQLTTEKAIEFTADIFVDATGDGMLAVLAGAEYMTGREDRGVFGEAHALDKRDMITMGNSLMFTSKDAGYPVPFIKPPWAFTYEESDLKFRSHGDTDAGYWWIELGGDGEDVIKDGEFLRDELIKSVFGVWDHIKNRGDHKADNLVLDWVGYLPGKRESRRIVGDYILKEHDLQNSTVFPDAAAYGGWPMDMHAAGGLRNQLSPTEYFHMPDVYTIPYRCLYSKTIKNLGLAGRALSVSHMAFGSIRVMATLAVAGQAVGSACAIAARRGISLCEVNAKELQQTLIKDDCNIPGFAKDDPEDLAKTARISCSSETCGELCANVTNGCSRPEIKYPQGWEYWKNCGVIPDNAEVTKNCWTSGLFSPGGEWISLSFPGKIQPKEIRLKFDSNLSKELTPSIEQRVLRRQTPGIPSELVKDYIIEYKIAGEIIASERVTDNYLRFRVHRSPQAIECDEITVRILTTNGAPFARIFEISVY